MTMNSSKNFSSALQQLKSEDADVRKRGIQTLARTQDRSAIAAIRPLRDFDPDNEVRMLAARAIRYIQEQTQTMPTVGGNTLLESAERRTGEVPVVKSMPDEPVRKPVTGSLLKAGQRRTAEVPAIRVDAEDGTQPERKKQSKRRTMEARAVRQTQEARPVQAEEPSQVIAGPKVWTKEFQPVERSLLADMLELDKRKKPEIHHEQREQARMLVQNAYSDYKHNTPIAGIRKLTEALRIDPSVQSDEFTHQTITALFRMPLDDGLALLKNKSARDIYIERRRRDLDGARMFTTWMSTLMDVGAVFAAQFIGLSLVLLALMARSNALMAALASNEDYGFQVRTTGIDPAADYQQIAAMLNGQTTTSILIYAAVVAIVSVVVMFVGSMVAHAAARYALGGTATVTESEANFSTPVAGFAGIVYAIAAAVIYVLYPTTFAGAAGGINPIIAWACIGAIVGAFVGVIGYQSKFFGTAHGFGRVSAGIAVIMGMGTVLGLAYLLQSYTGIFTL
ncbi:MAG: HEAT repeat domain-containing protein [Chloroflexota bacterium]